MFYTRGNLYFTLLHPFLLQVYVLVTAVVWVSAMSLVVEGLVHRGRCWDVLGPLAGEFLVRGP